MHTITNLAQDMLVYSDLARFDTSDKRRTADPRETAVPLFGDPFAVLLLANVHYKRSQLLTCATRFFESGEPELNSQYKRVAKGQAGSIGEPCIMHTLTITSEGSSSWCNCSDRSHAPGCRSLSSTR